MEKIRVIIIDEQPLFREGIRITLERDDCIIVGESTHVDKVLEIIRTTIPDVALIDAGLVSSDPLEIARQMRHHMPHMAIIILTRSDDEECLFQSIKVGAVAYYSRHIPPEDLMDAVRKVSQGEYLINSDILSQPLFASRLLASFCDMTSEKRIRNESRHISSPLSQREIEILDSIVHGCSNKEIAKKLAISDQTVKNHITLILKKLSVHDRTAAVVKALHHGWIKIETTVK